MDNPIPSSGEDHFVLVNAYEEPVKQLARELMEEMGACQCDKCFYDVCAMVLNSGYSYYVTTPKGQLLTQLNTHGKEHRTKLIVKIMDCVKRVMEKPQH